MRKRTAGVLTTGFGAVLAGALGCGGAEARQPALSQPSIAVLPGRDLSMAVWLLPLLPGVPFLLLITLDRMFPNAERSAAHYALGAGLGGLTLIALVASAMYRTWRRLQ